MQALRSSSERRTSKKSFNSCRECRQRKVKCDEVPAICGPCVDTSRTRGTIHPVAQPLRHGLEAAIHHLIQPLTPSIPNPIGTTKTTFSLRLFYHYLREVAPHLPQAHNANVREMWMVDIPQLVFECDYLLNGILSVATLQLHRTRAPDDTSLLKASRVYFDSCIKVFQNAIDHLDSRMQNMPSSQEQYCFFFHNHFRDQSIRSSHTSRLCSLWI